MSTFGLTAQGMQSIFDCLLVSMEVYLGHLGQVQISRSLGQDQGHMQKIIIYLFQLVIPLNATTGN